MTVKFDMDLARDCVGQYESAIDSLDENIKLIHNTYISLRSKGWSGAASDKFSNKFSDVYYMWNKAIEQLESTKQALEIIEQTAEPIHNMSSRLM